MEEKEPLLLRVINNFENLNETSFLPKYVQEPVDALMHPTTFTDLSRIMDSNNFKTISESVDKSYSKYMREYRSYLNDLEKMPNVFSNKINFI